MARHEILRTYDQVRSEAKRALYSEEITGLLTDLYRQCLDHLAEYDRAELISKVPRKEYFAFEGGDRISRAINVALYDPDFNAWAELRDGIERDTVEGIAPERLTSILYTMAISFCASVDLLKSGDQKTPGTFFEYFIAYFFTWRVGVNPQNSIQVLNVDGEDTRLPTDFIYNLGPKLRKFHMPIKTSTRERSIMLWAHQKLLDGVYGTGRFMGTPVLLAETKTDKKKREVVEICLPEQWRIYQLYISKLKRIYYLDLPLAYERLNDEFPPLWVRPFGEFFWEWDHLAPE